MPIGDDPNPTRTVSTMSCPACLQTNNPPEAQGRGQMGNNPDTALWGIILVCPTCGVVLFDKD